MFTRAILILSAVMVAACSTPHETARDRFHSIDSVFAANIAPDGPGAAVLVMKNDSVLFEKGYGLADLRTREPVTPKTLFNVGSISKTFVANAILMLQEQGRLSMEDSLLKYFPEFTNKDIASQVKIKHLLTHTSGLPDNREPYKDSVFYLTAKDVENWKPIMQAHVLNAAPGTRFEYSNPAFNGLALIVEKVSGMRWQSFVEQNIMRPSGMTASTITDGPHPASGVAHAYVQYSRGQWSERDYGEEPTFAAAGNGGVWSSVEELALYEKALEKAAFLKPETITDSRTVKQFPQWKDTTTLRTPGWIKSRVRRDNGTFDPYIGWSWFIHDTPDAGRMVGHTGSQGGFLANYVVLPEKKIFFVFLCNAPHDFDVLTRSVMSTLKKENWLDE